MRRWGERTRHSATGSPLAHCHHLEWRHTDGPQDGHTDIIMGISSGWERSSFYLYPVTKSSKYMAWACPCLRQVLVFNHFCFALSLTLINNKGWSIPRYRELKRKSLNGRSIIHLSTEFISHNLQCQWQIPLDLRSIWDFIDSPRPKSIDKTL